MLTVMTWNLENLERPESTATPAERAAYAVKLEQTVQVIADADPDLLGVQEVLARADDLQPQVFEDLRSALSQRTGSAWTGHLSKIPDPRGIRVGWLSRGALTEPVDVAAYPPLVPPTVIDDTGETLTAAKRGALAITYTHADGQPVQALVTHLKSKLLTFPGYTPDRPRFDTRDEGERARYGLYALDQRAAEAATVRAWATQTLDDAGQQRRVIVCGDLNDLPEAATTQLLLGPPGSQLGTGGYERPDRGDAARLWNLAPRMPAGDPDTGDPPANWSRINNGVKELIDQILVSHALVRALDSTYAIPVDGIRSVTADPASLEATTAPSDHRPVVARFLL